MISVPLSVVGCVVCDESVETSRDDSNYVVISHASSYERLQRIGSTQHANIAGRARTDAHLLRHVALTRMLLHQHRQLLRLPLVPHLLATHVATQTVHQHLAASRLPDQRRHRLRQQLDVRQVLLLGQRVAQVVEVQEDLNADGAARAQVLNLQEEVRGRRVVDRENDGIIWE